MTQNDFHWGPLEVTAVQEANAFAGDIAINASGDAVVIMIAENHQIQASYKPCGIAWQPPEMLSDDVDHNVDPHVAIDDAGNIVAIWSSWDPRGSVVRSAYCPAGGRWQPPRDISPTDTCASSPCVSISPGVAPVAVWDELDQHQEWGRLVSAALMLDNGAWGSPTTISAARADASCTVSSPSLATDRLGNVWAMWQWYPSRIADKHVVKTAFMPAGGSWQPERVLSGDAPAWAPTIVTDNKGNAGAVWNRKIADSHTSVVDFASCFLGGPWHLPCPLSAESHHSAGADLAFDVDGNAMATWNDIDSMGRSTSWTASRSLGGDWTAGTRLPEAGKRSHSARIVFARSGWGVCAWIDEQAQGVGVVRAAVRLPDGRWSPSQTMSAQMPHLDADVDSFEVAIGDNGHAIIAWTSRRITGQIVVEAREMNPR